MPERRLAPTAAKSRAAAAMVCAGISILASIPAAALTDMPAGSYAAPPLPWLIPGAVLWLCVEIGLLAGVCVRSPVIFSLLLTGAMAVGMGIFTLDRFGLDLAGWRAWAGCCLVAIPLGASSLLLLKARDGRVPAIRATRLFLVGCILGAVYQYSGTPGTAVAHLRAVAVAVAILSLIVAYRRQIGDVMNRLKPRVTATALWVGAVVLLVLNGLVVAYAGTLTAQVSIAGISVAPYFAAGLLMLIAIAVEWQGSDTRTALQRTTIGFAVIGGLTALLLDESSTVVMWAWAVVLVVALLAPGRITVTVLVVAVSAAAFFTTPAGAAMAGHVSARASHRIAVWGGSEPSPAQLTRAFDATDGAGALGFAGAARPQLLIGTEATKDYAPVVVLAQGGWLGLSIAVVVLVWFARDLIAATLTTNVGLGRAVAAAVVVLLASSITLTLTWLVGLTPLLGLPLPTLARGGSHLIVYAMGLGLLDAVSDDQTNRAT